MAVLGMVGQGPPDVGPGFLGREAQHAVLVLDHHAPFCHPTRYRRHMTADPRGALATLVTAFERHLEASASKRGEEDPTVIAAYDDLADAFAAYDDALLQAYGEMTPLDVYDGDDDDDDDDELDDSDDDGGGPYSGLDADDYDSDDADSDGDDSAARPTTTDDDDGRGRRTARRTPRRGPPPAPRAAPATRSQGRAQLRRRARPHHGADHARPVAHPREGDLGER